MVEAGAEFKNVGNCNDGWPLYVIIHAVLEGDSIDAIRPSNATLKLTYVYLTLLIVMLDSVVRFVAIALLSAWCFILIRPFVALLLWGAIIAVVLYPGFLWLSRRLGDRPKLSATLLTLVGAGIILGPFSLTVKAAIDSVQAFATNLANDSIQVPPPPPQIAAWPLVGDSLDQVWQDASRDLALVLEQYNPQLQDLAGKLLALAGVTSIGVLQFFIATIIAGGLMLNADAIANGLRRFILRLNPKQGEDFMTLTVATIRNVTRGVIGIAVFQTVLLSIGYVLAVFPLAGLLIVVCLVLSIVQIGPGLVVLPSVIYAWYTMGTFKALVFTIWMVAAASCDNFLKPVLMGRGLSVPMLVVFIGVIGGTLAHGIVGLFIGPVILAVGYELLRAWVNDEPEITTS